MRRGLCPRRWKVGNKRHGGKSRGWTQCGKNSLLANLSGSRRHDNDRALSPNATAPGVRARPLRDGDATTDDSRGGSLQQEDSCSPHRTERDGMARNVGPKYAKWDQKGISAAKVEGNTPVCSFGGHAQKFRHRQRHPQCLLSASTRARSLSRISNKGKPKKRQ